MKQYRIDLLPLMTDEQRGWLKDILVAECQRLLEAENKYLKQMLRLEKLKRNPQ